jgi:hypothetical protein
MASGSRVIIKKAMHESMAHRKSNNSVASGYPYWVDIPTSLPRYVSPE